MQSSAPPQAEPKDAPTGVTPLTCAKEDGTPYKRFADIEQEIFDALASAQTSWALASMKSETLVHLVRQIRCQPNVQVIGQIIGELGRRIARIVKDYSGGLSKGLAEELSIEVATDVDCLIFETVPTRKGEYLEIAFRDKVTQLTINKIGGFKDRSTVEPSPESKQVSSDVDNYAIAKAVPDSRLGPAELTLNKDAIRRGLAAISDPRHREATILHYLQGWPIIDKGTNGPTLSTHFDMSDRMIRKWLEVARDEMRTALGDSI